VSGPALGASSERSSASSTLSLQNVSAVNAALLSCSRRRRRTLQIVIEMGMGEP
jgi:hypothetical protein